MAWLVGLSCCSIHHIPVLELIFDYLPVPDLKNVSLVCLQWSNLAFSGRRMHRVRLNVDYRYDDTQDYLTLLRGSKRQYRHVLLEIDSTENTLVSNFIELLEHFKSSVDSLKLVLDFIEYAQIRSILLEVPNLKKLSLQAMVQSGSAQAANLMQSPIKPLPQLTDLVLQSDSSLHLQAFDICTIAPNLKRLDMDCDSSRALEVFSHFSEQLESVAVFFKTNILFLRFCEISFPELLEIDFYSDNEHFHDGVTVLTLDGWLRCKVFEGCKPLPALQELCLQSATMDDTLEFFKPLPAMMPNLRKLDIIELDMDDSCLHFICKHMVSLHQILLEICPNAENRIVPSNNVRGH
ncbi:hypothetical protein ZHAS_00004842 [Anopheles sinensis]|uniref:F-box domain-containing protein n=1 Tax=Anopheles sinensis TaxID=74873 RepID=A0A084VI06_ANOSI|nr:hypothetical protein ZHAS_00004842 [Anopheles sinensis]